MTSPERRTLRFESLPDLVAEAERIAAGGGRSSGGWTAAQNIDHVAAVIEASCDGFDFTVPLPLRLFGRLMKGRFLKKGFGPGFKVPKGADTFVPAADATIDGALERLRGAVARADAPNGMQVPSPLLGSMSRADWTKLHCRHAELHFSFLHPE